MIIYMLLNKDELRELVSTGELHKYKGNGHEDNIKQSILRDKLNSNDRYCLDGYVYKPEDKEKTVIVLEEDNDKVLKYSSKAWDKIEVLLKDKRTKDINEIIGDMTNRSKYSLDKCLIWNIKLGQIVGWK